MFDDDPIRDMMIVFIICGLAFIAFFTYAGILTFELEAQVLDHCQENGFEKSFYKSSWYYCFSEERVSRIKCVENTCHIFNEEESGVVE